MLDDDGPWYDGLTKKFDTEHRVNAIENWNVRSLTYQLFVFFMCVSRTDMKLAFFAECSSYMHEGSWCK